MSFTKLFTMNDIMSDNVNDKKGRIIVNDFMNNTVNDKMGRNIVNDKT